jgi:sortase A
MQATRRAGRSRRGSRLLVWAESLLIMGGTAALTWCTYIVGDAYITQRLAREALESTPHVVTASPSAVPPASAKVPRSPAPGTPLAELTIPSVGLSAAVLHGSDAHTLSLGLGHIENTPLPGESGNVAIAGHRDSFFRPLRKVKVGDDILLDTPEERLHYRVSSLRVVNSHEVGVIGPTKDPTLTLVTCYPFWFIGNAPDRFVVRATRVEEPPRAASTALATGAESSPQEARGAHSDLISDTRPPENKRTETVPNDNRPARTIGDDDRRVRETVEHFRVMYNGRLDRLDRAGSDKLPPFPFCAVAVGGQAATATCNAASRDTDSLPPSVWTFGLAITGGEWAVTSVSMR